MLGHILKMAHSKHEFSSTPKKRKSVTFETQPGQTRLYLSLDVFEVNNYILLNVDNH